MANVQHPGFAPLKHVSGGNITYRRKRVLSSNTNAISLHDAVVTDSAGDCILATTATSAIASVACGVSYVSSGSRIGAKSLPATTTYSGTTNDPLNASYVFIMEDAVSVLLRGSIDEAIVQTGLGINYKMVLGSATNGISGHELDATTPADTATFPFRVNDFIFEPGNDVDAADAHVECQINAGFIQPALTTTGT